jgi:predicted amidophosphoribosyltransferase
MYCSKCGANVPDGTAFCSACGQPMPGFATSQPAGATPATPGAATGARRGTRRGVRRFLAALGRHHY